ncbi:MAG: hypothetical protein ACOY4D_05540 [Pseudomonadota bacterium]
MNTNTVMTDKELPGFYIVSYDLAYQHRVNICVHAKDAGRAVALVQERFDNGTLWDIGNPDCYLVYDDFEEEDDNVLCFEARGATAVDCVPDRTVETLRLHEVAWTLLQAAKAVVANWEGGDLAAAVRNLASVVSEAETLR